MRFTNGTLNMVYNAAAARKHFGNLKRDNNVCDHIGRDWEGCLYACVSKRTMTLWCLWG